MGKTITCKPKDTDKEDLQPVKKKRTMADIPVFNPNNHVEQKEDDDDFMDDDDFIDDDD